MNEKSCSDLQILKSIPTWLIYVDNQKSRYVWLIILTLICNFHELHRATEPLENVKKPNKNNKLIVLMSMYINEVTFIITRSKRGNKYTLTNEILWQII